MATISNPFARLMGTLPSLIPKPEIAPEPGAISMNDGGLPAFPSTAQPKVALRPFDPQTASPQELAAHPLVSRLRADEAKDINPWGTSENHPGFFGKLGHALSVATGGPNRRMYEEMGLQKSLQDLLGEQSKNELEGAQTKNLESQIEERETPESKDNKPYTIQTDEGVLQFDPEKSVWSPIQVNGETAMPYAKPTSEAANKFQHVAGTSAGKQIYANYDPQKGQFTDLQGNVLSDFKPSDRTMQGVLGQYAPVRLLQGLLNTAYNDNPALLPIVGKLASQIMAQYGISPQQAESTLGATPEGQPQSSEGANIGLKMPEAPTGMTRSRGQFAEAVLPSMDDAKTEIQKLGDKLGPMAGRYNELATGRIGAFGPEFAGLQTTLHNIATAWMRLHANSDNARQDFINQLKAAQDPANLAAVLDSIEKQATDYVAQGKGRTANQTWAAPKDAPAAPKEDGKYLYDGDKPIAKSSGGKWVKP